MDISGSWQNEYGSIMVLEQSSARVSGTYRSSTGSTGEYLVLGSTDPNPNPSRGQSLALSIFWRSTSGGDSDPSWHWVSGMSGQLTQINSKPTLNLIHALVATTDDPQVANIGTYIDKLLYTQTTLPSSRREVTMPKLGAKVGDPIEGTWTCNQDRSTSLILQVDDIESGVVSGQLLIAQIPYQLMGFTDTYFASDMVLQGLAVTAMVTGDTQQPAKCIALAGSLNRAEDILSLLDLTSQGTAPDSTYIQTKVRGLTFHRSGTTVA